MNMKKYVFFLLICLFTLNAFAQKTPTAQSVLDKAFKQAKKQNKKVFLIFHASWCGWCKRMEKAILDKNCKDFFEKNYIITYLTVLESPANKSLENQGASEVLEKYGGEGQGLPYWVILDKNGSMLEDSKDKGENIGCPAEAFEVDAFIEKLKKTSNITNDDIKNIRSRFLANKN